MNYREIKGDLVELTKQGYFDVITHGCNCFSTMGAGIAVPMKNNFGCDMFPREAKLNKQGEREAVEVGNIDKLGCIDYQTKIINSHTVTVVNSYTQYRYGRNHADGDKCPVDYDAIALCMRKINHQFRGQRIGLPMIGCGLAGGDWNIVSEIIQSELFDCDVTVVVFDK